MVEEARAMMERQMRHLVRLVDDLLDVSRIARGKVVVNRDPLRLSEVIDHAGDAATRLGRHK